MTKNSHSLHLLVAVGDFVTLYGDYMSDHSAPGDFMIETHHLQ